MSDPKPSRHPSDTDFAPGVAEHSGLRRLMWHGLFLLALAMGVNYSYLLFHSLAEIYGIVIATGIFLIAWNTRSHYRNDYFLFIGIAYLFVAGFDTLHMLGYHGMGIFKEVPGYNLGPQLWLTARLLEAGTLFIAPTFLHRPLRREFTFFLLILISGAALWSIFVARVFPDCFIPDHGLTLFKIVGEYLIVAILLGALLRLYRHRRTLDRRVYRLLFLSLLTTIASELCFTLYVSHYGHSNLAGHLFKIASFTLIYYAMIETVLRRPFAILFRDLKQRQTRLLAAQRAAKLGSWSWHPNRREMTWSEEMYPRLGYLRNGTEPSLDLMLAAICEEDREPLRQALETAKITGEEFQLEVRRKLPDDSIRYLRIEGGCETDEECEPLLAGIVQDVTERVAAEHLRKEIDSITQHDLRTPLTPIIGIPEVLLMTGRNLDDEQRQMLEDLRQSGLRMLALLNNSLTLYKLEQGTYRLQPEQFDLCAEIREILKEVAEKAAERQVVCRLAKHGQPDEPSAPLWIFGERLLCYTLFANLITNAVEASPVGETVIIELDETARQWRIAIHNSGEVPESFRPHFFDKYATRGKKGGTGLGTYSAMMAARAHGGVIHLHSGDGYTTVTVELPKPQVLIKAETNGAH